MPILYIDSGSFRDLQVTGSSTFSDSVVILNNLVVTGSLTIITGSAIELQVTNTGVTIGNAITDVHNVTGSLRISGSITGSLFGTSSWSSTSLTASFLPVGTYNITSSWATTSSFTLGPVITNGTANSLLFTGSQTVAGAKTFSSTPKFSTMTANSVLFAGTSGILSQNTNTLVWDDTNTRLGIANNSPQNTLHVGTSTSFMKVAHRWNNNAGIWIDLSTDGASGIGNGGPGQSPWIAYAAAATQWFSTANTGDICYRNLSGRLLYGNSQTCSLQIAEGTVAFSGSMELAIPAFPSFFPSYTGEVVKFGAGTLTTGRLYFYSSSGTWSLADASTTGSSIGMLGLATGTSPTTNGLLIRGYAASSSFNYGTGSIVYMATSSGIMTSTPPSSSNHVVRVLGYQVTGNTIYFDPDKTWVTLA